MREITKIEKEVFLFLNILRDSGVTNMYGATPYIIDEFPQLSKKEAKNLLFLWMKNFDIDGNYTHIKE